MALTRKKTLLAKIESVYGTDPTPTGSANAMLVKNLTPTPLSAELVSRDLVRPYLGNSENLIAQKFVQLDFEVELVGSGAVGLTPAYDPLLRACGFAKTATTAAIGITRSGATATATLTAHGYSVGDKVVISGADQAEYNGTQTILTVPTSGSFTFAVTGTPATPATGSPVVTTKNTYAPVSSSFESVTLYFNQDGLNHKVTGARGTVEFGINVKQIPSMKFSFQGIYNAPSDVAAPSVNYDAFMIPQVANTQNTPVYSLFSYSASGLESVSLNMANEVVYASLIGSESVKIIDRKPAGTVVLEAPALATKDFFAIAVAQTSGALTVTQDSRNGYKVKLTCGQVLLGNPNYSDSNGTSMLSIPFTANPSSSGNDEVSIEVL